MSERHGTWAEAESILLESVERIASVFKGSPLVTVVVRNPAIGDDADVVITNDDHALVAAAVERSRKREATRTVPRTS